MYQLYTYKLMCTVRGLCVFRYLLKATFKLCIFIPKTCETKW